MASIHQYPHIRSHLPILARSCAVISLAIFWTGTASVTATEKPAASLNAGKAVYQQSCARCHGEQGHGDGVDAKRFYPRPRDLALGVYKFRSTASGTPPSDEDLFHTITAGLPGTNMPDWQHLDEDVRWQLVRYLKSLSPVFQQTKPVPVQTAPDPGLAHTNLKKGKALYEQLGCAACHGTQGRANGSSAGGLVDDWGLPIRPADLTQGWAYRGGSEPKDVMMRVLAGIDGAGMPSYTGALSPEDAWSLAYYVASLQEPPHWHLIAHASYSAGPLPETIDDPRWASAESTTVRVRNVVTAEGEWQHPPTVRAITFQVVYNNQAAAMKCWWDDPTQESGSALDALAILLKPAGSQGDVVTLQAWPYAGGPTLDVTYWAADRKQPVELLTTDFMDVMAAQADSQTGLKSTAAYQDGRWSLIIQRPLAPDHPKGAAIISTDGLTSIAFAVWDGTNANARAVSPWLDIRFSRHVRKAQ